MLQLNVENKHVARAGVVSFLIAASYLTGSLTAQAGQFKEKEALYIARTCETFFDRAGKEKRLYFDAKGNSVLKSDSIGWINIDCLVPPGPDGAPGHAIEFGKDIDKKGKPERGSLDSVQQAVFAAHLARQFFESDPDYGQPVEVKPGIVIISQDDDLDGKIEVRIRTASEILGVNFMQIAAEDIFGGQN
jgi:hypothetical protein